MINSNDGLKQTLNQFNSMGDVALELLNDPKLRRSKRLNVMLEGPLEQLDDLHKQIRTYILDKMGENL